MWCVFVYVCICVYAYMYVIQVSQVSTIRPSTVATSRQTAMLY